MNKQKVSKIIYILTMSFITILCITGATIFLTGFKSVSTQSAIENTELPNGVPIASFKKDCDGHLWEIFKIYNSYTVIHHPDCTCIKDKLK